MSGCSTTGGPNLAAPDPEPPFAGVLACGVYGSRFGQGRRAGTNAEPRRALDLDCICFNHERTRRDAEVMSESGQERLLANPWLQPFERQPYFVSCRKANSHFSAGAAVQDLAQQRLQWSGHRS